MDDMDVKTWERIGLLDGLTGRQKKMCSEAFNKAIDYLVMHRDKGMEDKLVLSVESITINELIEKKDISATDMMKLFSKKNRMIEVNFTEILIPMIRRVISGGKQEFVLHDFITHCHAHIRTFNPKKYRADSDWQAEIAAYLAESFL